MIANGLLSSSVCRNAVRSLICSSWYLLVVMSKAMPRMAGLPSKAIGAAAKSSQRVPPSLATVCSSQRDGKSSPRNRASVSARTKAWNSGCTRSHADMPPSSSALYPLVIVICGLT
jgi:hypothetical protein